MTEILFALVLGGLLLLVGRGIEPPPDAAPVPAAPGLLHDLAAGVVVLVHLGRAYASTIVAYADSLCLRRRPGSE